MSTASGRQVTSKALSISVLIDPSHSGLPLYAQLHRQLREHLMSGTIAPGSTLPSSRVLAADLQLSRNTVEAAISQLCAEGFVTRRVGAGTVVTDMKDVAPFRARRANAPGAPGSVRRMSAGRPVAGAPELLSPRGLLLSAGGRVEIDSDNRTGLCMTDVSRFPMRLWDRIVSRVSRERGATLLQSGEMQGDIRLREAISDHARLTRGLRCAPDQVLILNSTQQALDLSGRLLLSDGDVALVEEPGYRSARATFAACGARVRGVPVDAHGLQPECLAHHAGARMLYLTPSHHFPLGVSLPLQRRLAVLKWADENDCWILEDDYDSEFRYDGRPIAAMQGLDRADRVLYVGTFNKVLFPGIRVAYLIVPPGLANAFVNARRLVDGGAPTLVQAVLAEFLAGGHFAQHLRRSRKYYESQRDLLVHCLRTECGAAVTIGASETGLHLVAHLPTGVSDEVLASAGTGNGLGVAPLSHYYAEAHEGVPRGLLFSFGGADEAAIRSGVKAIGLRMQSHASPVLSA